MDDRETRCLATEKVRVEAAGKRRLTLLLCDDERAQVEQLKGLLEQLDEEKCFRIETGTRPEDLLHLLLERAQTGEPLPDVVFLDIRMPGMDGIAFGKKLRSVAPDIYIVFMTSYEEYAIEGYEARAFRYLLKPLKPETLKTVMTEIRNDMGRQKKLVIWLAEKERLLALDEIVYLGAEDKYTVLHTANEYFVDRTSLSEYERLLKPYGFSRIHRKYLVNLRHHKSLEKSYVTLSDGVRLPISRRREAAYYNELFACLGTDLLI